MWFLFEPELAVSISRFAPSLLATDHSISPGCRISQTGFYPVPHRKIRLREGRTDLAVGRLAIEILMCFRRYCQRLLAMGDCVV